MRQQTSKQPTKVQHKARLPEMADTVLTHLAAILVLIGTYQLGELAYVILPLPATINGLLILLFMFIIYGQIPDFLARTVPLYLKHMSLFFVPAVMAVWLYQQAVLEYWHALVLSLVVTTILSMLLVLWVAHRCLTNTPVSPEKP